MPPENMCSYHASVKSTVLPAPASAFTPQKESISSPSSPSPSPASRARNASPCSPIFADISRSADMLPSMPSSPGGTLSSLPLVPCPTTVMPPAIDNPSVSTGPSAWVICLSICSLHSSCSSAVSARSLVFFSTASTLFSRFFVPPISSITSSYSACVIMPFCKSVLNIISPSEGIVSSAWAVYDTVTVENMKKGNNINGNNLLWIKNSCNLKFQENKIFLGILGSSI